MKKNSILFLIILLLSACMKEIPYDGDFKSSQLVLNGIVEVDSTFSVYLEKSIFFLSNSFDDALITSGAEIEVKNLSTNESFIVSQPTELNRYDFPFITTPNTEYSIEVSHPDFPDISAETATLSKADIIEFNTAFLSGGQNNNRLQVTMTFQDPPEENYYLVKASYLYTYEEYIYDDNTGELIGTDTVQGIQQAYIKTNDPSVDNSENMDIDGYIYSTQILLFPDNLFENQQKSFVFEIEVWGEQEYQEIIDNGLTVELVSMNEETFKYIKSAKKNSYNDAFSEPTKVYSNIKNGFGIFGFLYYSKMSL